MWASWMKWSWRQKDRRWETAETTSTRRCCQLCVDNLSTSLCRRAPKQLMQPWMGCNHGKEKSLWFWVAQWRRCPKKICKSEENQGHMITCRFTIQILMKLSICWTLFLLKSHAWKQLVSCLKSLFFCFILMQFYMVAKRDMSLTCWTKCFVTFIGIKTVTKHIIQLVISYNLLKQREI